jgi:hypothetical protein
MSRIFPVSLSRYRDYARHASLMARLYPLSWIDQLTPFDKPCSDAPTCVVGNGIPKSGTYLINAVLDNLGRWRQTGLHINRTHWDDSTREPPLQRPCLQSYALRKLRNGHMAAAHLPYDPATESVIAHPVPGRSIRHILLFRDMRDTFCSYARYATRNKTFGELAPTVQKFMRENFETDEQRLTWVIGERIDFHFMRYHPWLTSPAALAVKFEDLYTDMLKAQDGEMGATLGRIVDYLDVPRGGIDLPGLSARALGNSTTASAESNKIGQYKRYFTDEHYRMCDTAAFRKTLASFGYDW